MEQSKGHSKTKWEKLSTAESHLSQANPVLVMCMETNAPQLYIIQCMYKYLHRPLTSVYTIVCAKVQPTLMEPYLKL